MYYLETNLKGVYSSAPKDLIPLQSHLERHRELLRVGLRLAR